uniref:hypothetical protein n=1 Tax=uncultured Draconibacterium sp. TaxID=1573823 RepID=UPI0032179F20
MKRLFATVVLVVLIIITVWLIEPNKHVLACRLEVYALGQFYQGHVYARKYVCILCLEIEHLYLLKACGF